jgi:hypothetical protein
MTKEKNRYGDADLEEFRSIIERKLSEAREGLVDSKGVSFA